MKRAEILLAAMGDVGDDLLREAEEKPRGVMLVRWGALAACLALILCALPLFLHQAKNGAPEDSDPDIYDVPPGEGAMVAGVGQEYETAYGVVCYLAYEPGRVTIQLDKTDERIIHWRLSGDDIHSTWTDENGKPAYDMDSYYFSTDPVYRESGTRVEGGIAFVVDGVATDAFPTLPGKYHIVIDYTRLLERCTEMDVWIISDMGAFSIGKYATQSTVIEVGKVLTTDYGIVEYRDLAEGRITIFLKKADDREIGWLIDGRTYWSDGVTDSVRYVYAASDERHQGAGFLVEGGVTFVVNGQSSTSFPSTAGEYEIVIDYTKMLNACEALGTHFITDLGWFWLIVPEE